MPANELAPLDFPMPRLQTGAYDARIASAPNLSMPQLSNYSSQAMASFASDFGAINQTFKAMYEKQRGISDAVFNDKWNLEYSIESARIQEEMANSPDAGSPEYVQKLDSVLAKRGEELRRSISEQSGYELSQEGRLRNHHTEFNFRRVITTDAAKNAVVTQRGLAMMSAQDQINKALQNAASEDNLEGGLAEAEQISNYMLRPIMSPTEFAKHIRTTRGAATEQVINARVERGDVLGARAAVDVNNGFPVNTDEMRVARALGPRGVPAVSVLGALRSDPLWQNIHDDSTNATMGLPPEATVIERQQAIVEKSATVHGMLKNKLGRNPNAAEFKLAWMGFGNVLQVPADTPVSEMEKRGFLPKGTIERNPEIMTKTDGLQSRPATAREVIDWAYNNQIRHGGMDASAYLPEAQRRQLLGTVESKTHSLQEQAIREQERLRQQRATAGMKMFSDAKNENDAGKMQAIASEFRKDFTYEQYETINAVLRGETVTNEDQAFIYEAKRFAQEGSMEEKQFEQEIIYPALKAKQISPKTALDLLQENLRTRKELGIDHPINAVRKTLQTAIDASTNVIRIPGQTDTNTARANAKIMNDYEIYVRTNPKATHEELMFKADELYKLHPYSKPSMQKSLVGPSAYFPPAQQKSLDSVTNDHVDEASIQLENDARSGKLGEAYVANERMRLANWRLILGTPTRESLIDDALGTKKPAPPLTRGAAPITPFKPPPNVKLPK